jgi:hypothetical protein
MRTLSGPRSVECLLSRSPDPLTSEVPVILPVMTETDYDTLKESMDRVKKLHRHVMQVLAGKPSVRCAL